VGYTQSLPESYSVVGYTIVSVGSSECKSWLSNSNVVALPSECSLFNQETDTTSIDIITKIYILSVAQTAMNCLTRVYLYPRKQSHDRKLVFLSLIRRHI